MDDLIHLQKLIHTCVETGYLKAQMDILPSTDRIRKKDAEELLRRNGFKKAMLSRWVSEGLVTEYKGEKNSPIWYSVMQIMETICTIRYKQCLT